ncbi:MAG: YlxR family protein [Actinomycetota bacterium]
MRVVRGPEGVAVDPTGKAEGRGAYVCRDPRCARTAARGLGRALRVTLGPDDLATLRMKIEQEMS